MLATIGFAAHNFEKFGDAIKRDCLNKRNGKKGKQVKEIAINAR